MRIDEILRNKRTLSFEVFPPRKQEGAKEALYATVQKLAELSPDFISVTYGAGGGDGRDNADIAAHIQACGVTALAHITGGPSSPDDVRRVAETFLARGVENVLALRGDRPPEAEEYCKYYQHATDLMQALRPYGFTMGAACYPEGHAECDSLYEDLEAMKKKEACGARFFITQLFYDNSYYYRLVNEARKAGIEAPILPGIMPLVNVKNLKHIKAMCGSAIPLDFRNSVERFAAHPAVLEELGLNYASYQILDLIAKGAPGVHLYVMNSARIAALIVERLRAVRHEFFGA